MATRQPQAPGGRKIRHVVMVTAEQETQLQVLATARGITISRLLADSALEVDRDRSTELLQSVTGLRKTLSNSGIHKFEADLTRLLER